MDTQQRLDRKLAVLQQWECQQVSGGWEEGDGICPDWFGKRPFPFPPKGIDFSKGMIDVSGLSTNGLAKQGMPLSVMR